LVLIQYAPLYDNATALEFLDMVPQPQQHMLSEMAPGTVAWGAYEEGRPVGLVLGKVRDGQQVADLATLFVQPAFRGHGIGQRLFHEFQAAVKARGGKRILTEFLIEKNDYEERTEHFLRYIGFAPTEEAFFVFTMDITDVSHLDWFRVSRLPNGFTVFPWRELTQGEREDISHGQDVWYPAILSPFHDEEQIDLDISVGMRYEGRVVGWLMMQPLARNMLLYKALFVKSEFRPMGRALAMAVEMLRNNRMAKLAPFATVIIESNNAEMLRIVRRRAAPLVRREQVLRRTQKQL
jgi:GNAT superfamily N-acetyltransferase